MIKRNKLFAITMGAIMMMSMSGCGNNNSQTENQSTQVAQEEVTNATSQEVIDEIEESEEESEGEVIEETTGEESANDAEETEASEATGTHTVVDHGGNSVEVPNEITRVVIDQIPILSTYMAYFQGDAPYIVGFCGSFKDIISQTVLKDIAPELLASSDTVYAQSDLNIEEIMKLEPDVILYNSGNTEHAEILKASGIPCIGFATVGADTEADPIERYEE